MQYKSQKGFSLAETLIAAVIFALATAGVFATIGVMRKPAKSSEYRLTASYIGQQFLANLRSKVDQNIWATGALSTDPHPPETVTVGSVTYTINYTVTQVQLGVLTSPKKVDLTITWTDPTP